MWPQHCTAHLLATVTASPLCRQQNYVLRCVSLLAQQGSSTAAPGCWGAGKQNRTAHPPATAKLHPFAGSSFCWLRLCVSSCRAGQLQHSSCWRLGCRRNPFREPHSPPATNCHALSLCRQHLCWFGLCVSSCIAGQQQHRSCLRLECRRN
jgi:hypothetical protein